MRSIITARRGAISAAVGALALGGGLLSAVAPAQAAALGKVEFVYSAPEISEEGDKVTWKWSVRNTSKETVDKVVLTHKLTPKLKVSEVSEPCEVQEASIRCEYGTMKAAAKKKGTLVAEIPPDTSGTVQINGRVTWQQGGQPTVVDETDETGEAPAEEAPVDAAPADEAA